MRKDLRSNFIRILSTAVVTWVFMCNANDLNGQNVSVSGRIQIDTSWHPEIYASRIPSLYDMYLCSEDIIVASSRINEDGGWKLELPMSRQGYIVRLHFIKKNSPIASLIIGGPDENHFFLGIDGQDIKVDKNKWPFTSFSAKDPLNQLLGEVNSTRNYWTDRILSVNEEQEKLRIKSQASEALIAFSDSTSTVLAGIYAAHLADEGFNQSKVYEAIGRINSRLGSHPYLQVYPNYPPSFYRSSAFSWMLFISGTIVLILLMRMLLMYMKQRKLSSLSQREMEVFKLLGTGMTNKEIASNLNVETSTVKSHINSIYGKLNIKSRKDTRKYRSHHI